LQELEISIKNIKLKTPSKSENSAEFHLCDRRYDKVSLYITTVQKRITLPEDSVVQKGYN
jgi:hypothetical protein